MPTKLFQPSKPEADQVTPSHDLDGLNFRSLRCQSTTPVRWEERWDSDREKRSSRRRTPSCVSIKTDVVATTRLAFPRIYHSRDSHPVLCHCKTNWCAIAGLRNSFGMNFVVSCTAKCKKFYFTFTKRAITVSQFTGMLGMRIFSHIFNN